MRIINNWVKYYWLIIFSLLLLPITNSFFVSFKKLVKSVINYKEYESLLSRLAVENKELSSKVEYYKTSPGIKALIKERLNKIEDDELIIKFDSK